MPRLTSRAPTATVKWYLLLLLARIVFRSVTEAFIIPPHSIRNVAVSTKVATRTATAVVVVVRATPSPGQQRPPPRRNLKKRPGRRNRNRRWRINNEVSWDDDTAELRPLTKSRSIEAGTDYWIDPEDLAREQERERAVKNRKAMEGEIPLEKLRTEVVAPYKGNWIGWLSVMVVVLVTIVTKFPELTNPPSIPYPDL